MAVRWRIDPEAVSTQQAAAAAAGCHAATVHWARRTGKLPAAPDGHLVR
jgi:hypothetical protein